MIDFASDAEGRLASTARAVADASASFWLGRCLKVVSLGGEWLWISKSGL